MSVLQLALLLCAATRARAAHTRIGLSSFSFVETTAVDNDNTYTAAQCDSGVVTSTTPYFYQVQACKASGVNLASSTPEGYVIASKESGACYGHVHCLTLPSGAAMTLQEIATDDVRGDDATADAACPSGTVLLGTGFYSNSATQDGAYPTSTTDVRAQDGASNSETRAYGYCASGLPIRSSTIETGRTGTGGGNPVDVSCPDGFVATGTGFQTYWRNCYRAEPLSTSTIRFRTGTGGVYCNGYVVCHDFYGCGDGVTDGDDNAEECDSATDGCLDACLYAPPALMGTPYYDGLVLEWASPCSNAASSTECDEPSGYQIDWREEGVTNSWNSIDVSDGTVTTITNVVPGLTYEVRIRAYSTVDPYNSLIPSTSTESISVDDENKISEWSPFTISCNCESATDPDGHPHSLQVVQEQDILYFEFASPNACNDVTVLSYFPTDDASATTTNVGSIATSQGSCSTAAVTRSSLTYSSGLLAIGTPYTFEVELQSSVQSDIKTSATFTPDFVGYLQIMTQTELGVILQGAEARVFVDATDYHLATVTIDEADPNLQVGDDVTASVDFSSEFDGVIMTFQTPSLTADSVTLRVEISQITSGIAHDFLCPDGSSCSSSTIDVTHLEYFASMVFVDASAFTVTGTVGLAGTVCGAAGITVCLTDVGAEAAGAQDYQWCMDTGTDGAYALSAVIGAEVVMSAYRTGHTIEALAATDFVLADNVDGLDFQDTTTFALTTSLGGGNCQVYLGEYTVSVIADHCDYSMTQTVGSESVETTGNLSIPAQAYTVTIADDPAVDIDGAYAESSISVDLLDGNSEATFVFNKVVDPAEDVIVTGGFLPSCGTTTVLGVQGVVANVTVLVKAVFENGECNDLGGVVTFFDRSAADTAACAADAGCSTQLVFDGQTSTAVFETVPEYPQVLETESLEWEQKVSILLDGFVTPVDYTWKLLVIGHKPVGDAFTMQFPSNVPLLVLHDPPGGDSFAQFLEATTFTTEIALGSLSTNSSAFDFALTLGFDNAFSTCAGVGLQVCNDAFSATLLTTFSFGDSSSVSVSDTQAWSTSLSSSVEVTTSAASGFTSGAGDMFLIPSLSIVYSLTDVVEFNTTTCAGQLRQSISWGIDGESDSNSFAWLSAWDIENLVIPELEANVLIETDEAKQALLTTAIDGWRETLATNEANKADATELGISFGGTTQSQIDFFGGGSALSYSVSTVRSSSNAYTVTSEVSEDSATALEVGAKVSGFVFDTVTTWTYQMVVGTTIAATNTTTDESSWSFVLQDPDIGDEFSVLVKQDPVYGTPVFETVGGVSSCQHEEGTVARNSFSVLIDPYSQSGILVTDTAEFSLLITNDVDEEYQIGIRKVLQSGDSPTVTLVGQGTLRDTPVDVFLPALSTTEFLLAVDVGLVDYSFTDVEIEVMPSCEWSLFTDSLAPDYYSDSAVFSVEFVPYCPVVEWGLDSSLFSTGDSCNPVVYATADTFEVVVLNSEFATTGLWQDNARVSSATLVYKKATGTTWINAVDSDGNSLSLIENNASGYSAGLWDVSALSDGEYLVKVVVSCTDSGLPSADISETSEISVLIDRGAPTAFGTPSPTDQIYWPGDDISITFSEPLLCSEYAWSVFSGAVPESCYVDYGQVDHENYLLVNPVPDGFPTSALSFLFWARLPANSTRTFYPISYASPSGHTNEILVQWTPNVSLGMYIAGSLFSLPNAAVSAGEWHHFGITWDSGTGEVHFYVDGAYFGGGSLGLGAIIAIDGALVIGQEQDAVGGGFDSSQSQLGELDELSIWNVALTADEVALYALSSAFDGTERGLFAAFSFSANDQDLGVVSGINDNMDLEIVGSLDVTCGSESSLQTSTNLVMDVACADSTIQFAFPFGFDVSTLAGETLTITVDGASDASGNVQPEAYSWSFVVDDTATYSLADLVLLGAVIATSTERGAPRVVQARQEYPGFVLNFRTQVSTVLGISIERVNVTSTVLGADGNFVVDFVITSSTNTSEPTPSELSPLLQTLVFGPTTGLSGIAPVAPPTATLVTSEPRPGQIGQSASPSPSSTPSSSSSSDSLSDGDGGKYDDWVLVSSVLISVLAGTVFGFFGASMLEKRKAVIPSV